VNRLLADDEPVNVSLRLRQMAALQPNVLAIADPVGTDRAGETHYEQVSFRQLEDDVELLARGLVAMGVTPGVRLALLVRPSIDFIALVFALLRAGAVSILIDPGMGRKNLLACLDAAEPRGFVAISPVQAVRTLLRGRFKRAKLNVTVGRRWFWGGQTLAGLRKLGAKSDLQLPLTRGGDPAAIIFTTGSTGPPKGVLYTHRIFDTQVTEIRDRYDIQPGEVDLPGFPLFGLFNAAMGVSTIVPEMDPTRPAMVAPKLIIDAIRRWRVTQSFGSPAIWYRIGAYCEAHQEPLPTLRRVLSAGAPVPTRVLAQMKAWIHPAGEMFTPYGATEALPVASISASEVLNETAARTAQGAGVCVGTRFKTIEWRVIRIVDGPIAALDETEQLPPGEIGELIVTGPQVTQQYATRTEWNALAKIADDNRIWHRMGDAGYLDEQQRFWFCGRVAHRVLTATGPMYTIPCEAIINQHAEVFRSALVGVGPVGNQTPILVVQLNYSWNDLETGRLPQTVFDRIGEELLKLASDFELTKTIHEILFHPSLPVDIRHNAKIFREKLAIWAEAELQE
jgi:acyl-CoA synthetase (AMP-forming)/AMP-acid ligase II